MLKIYWFVFDFFHQLLITHHYLCIAKSAYSRCLVIFVYVRNIKWLKILTRFQVYKLTNFCPVSKYVVELFVHVRISNVYLDMNTTLCGPRPYSSNHIIPRTMRQKTPICV